METKEKVTHTLPPLSLPWIIKPISQTEFFEVLDNDGDLIHMLLSKPEAEFIVHAVNEYGHHEAFIKDLKKEMAERLEIIEDLRKRNAALLEAGRLGVVVGGDFDDGAYGRYEEPVFCGWEAYFSNTPFDRTPHGRGNTPDEAIVKLFSNVKDKQRLEQKRQAIAQAEKGE